MQTFWLGDAAFTARALDGKRLVSQVKEAKQIIDILSGATTAWQSHPAVRMWVDHMDALHKYGWTMACEFRRRFGHTHVCHRAFGEWSGGCPHFPPWTTCGELILSHAAALAAKDPVYYAFLNVPAELDYVWYCHANRSYYQGQHSNRKTFRWLPFHTQVRCSLTDSSSCLTLTPIGQIPAPSQFTAVSRMSPQTFGPVPTISSASPRSSTAEKTTPEPA